MELNRTQTLFTTGNSYNITHKQWPEYNRSNAVFVGYDQEHDGEVKLACFEVYNPSEDYIIDMDFLDDKYYEITEEN